MKLIRLCYILAISIFFTPSQLFALTTSGTATGEIVVPISIVENTPLFFGKFAAVNAGNITLTPDFPAGKTVVGVSAFVSPTATAGKFTVTGNSCEDYNITLQSGTITLTSGANSMTVSNFTSYPSLSGTLTSGTQIIYVGGKLNASAGQAPGTYNGTYNITVNYN